MTSRHNVSGLHVPYCLCLEADCVLMHGSTFRSLACYPPVHGHGMSGWDMAMSPGQGYRRKQQHHHVNEVIRWVSCACSQEDGCPNAA
eukprot:1161696-Pelagomonas_calceolata.AAC.29